MKAGRFFVATLLLAGLRTAAIADSAPYLVKEFPNLSFPSASSPKNLCTVGSTTFFASTGPNNHGVELWKTDGTEAGTREVRDICLGVNGSSPLALTAVGSTLYFTATDGVNGRALWKSDGTIGGTVMVKDFYLPAGDRAIESLINVGGTLFFAADDGTRGTELWKSNGTSAGTVLVKDISAGAASSGIEKPVEMGGILYFFASDSVHGQRLWRSDGTTQGTFAVKEIEIGTSNGLLEALTVVGSTIFFSAYDTAHGSELWKSDGTEAGTVLVKDIVPGPYPSESSPVGSAGSTFYFKAPNNEGSHIIWLWKSDGTEAGTVPLKRFNTSEVNFVTVSSISYPATVGSTLFFFADDFAHGLELWKSDGSVAGTVMVADLSPYSSEITAAASAGGLYYFVAADSVHGRELWKSDGTAEGTAMVKDIAPGTKWSLPGNLKASNSQLYFVADDGLSGAELWKSDGTEGGTAMVKDINPGTSYITLNDASPTAAGSNLYFSLNDEEHGYELWKSDGTSAGTAMVKDIFPGNADSSPKSMVAMHGELFFYARVDLNNVEVWKSNGTEAGTISLVHAYTGSTRSLNEKLCVVNDKVFFWANNGTHGFELWKTDGTPAGTVKVKDNAIGSAISPPPSTNEFPPMVGDGDTLYFCAATSIYGAELWKSDGTEAGTVMVKDINPGPDGSGPSASGFKRQIFVSMGGIVYFGASQHGSNLFLWRTDGTLNGTYPVVPPSNGTVGALYGPQWLKPANGTMICYARNGRGDIQLYKSDGTEAGTSVIKTYVVGDILPGSSAFATNDNVYFLSGTAATGLELCKSDGTPAGTGLVKDIKPGSDTSSPSYLTESPSALYFAAADPVNGVEVWKSNGTSTGTVIMAEAIAGAGNSNARSLQLVGNKLFFFASTGPHEKALWAVNLNRPEAATLPPTALTSTSGTLHGKVTPNGNATAAWFELGTTTAYGRTVIVSVVPNNGINPLPVATAITGLSADTTYHCRLAAKSSAGIFYGDDIVFSTGGNNANLSILGLNSAALAPAFDPAVRDYSTTVPYSTASLALTPVAAHGKATIKVNGVAVTTGQPSTPVNLVNGVTALTVVVTAQDGVTSKTYTLQVTRHELTAQFETSGTAASEASGKASIFLTLSEPPVSQIVLPFTHADGLGLVAAGSAADITLPASPFIFNPGEVRKALSIAITGDSAYESNETLTLNLGAPTGGAALGSLMQHVVTIVDDDTVPHLAQTPANALVTVGSPLVLASSATGGLPLTFTWKLNGKLIPGATGPVYYVQKATLANAGNYAVTVRNASGFETATCEVGVYEKSVRKITALTSKDAVFTQAAAGNGLSFHWYKDGGATEVLGDIHAALDATKKTLTLKHPLSDEDANAYQCQVLQAPDGIAQDACLFHFHTVAAKPLLTAATLPSGQVGVYYSATVAGAANADTVSTWAASGLPAGLTINPLTGEISGYPTTVGLKTVTITATNAAGSASMLPAPKINITMLPTGISGTWHGLIAREPTVNRGIGSSITITITSQGLYTGKIITGITSLPISGQISVAEPNAYASTQFYQTGNVLTELDLQFLNSLEPDELRGSLAVTLPGSDGPLTAQINGVRQHSLPAKYAGRYNFDLSLASPDNANPSLPHGKGFGSAVVAASGAVSYAGRVGDGSVYTGASAVCETSALVLYASLYSGKGSLVGSPFIVLGGSSPGYPDSSIQNIVPNTIWTKLPDPTATGARTYPGGWSGVPVKLEGSKYNPMPAGTNALNGTYSAGGLNARLVFSGGGIDTTPPLPDVFLNLRTTGQIDGILAANNPRKTFLTVTNSTGYFTGGFTMTDTMPNGKPLVRPVAYYGQIVRTMGPVPSISSTTQGSGVFSLPQMPGVGELPSATPILSGSVELRP